MVNALYGKHSDRARMEEKFAELQGALWQCLRDKNDESLEYWRSLEQFCKTMRERHERTAAGATSSTD